MTSIAGYCRLLFHDSSARTWPGRGVVPILAGLTLTIASSCGDIVGNETASQPPVTKASSVTISGSVYGGQQAIANASVQAYATGTAGDGSASTTLLTTPATTDQAGSFTVTDLENCPSSVSEVYLVATGGSPVGLGGVNNPNASLMTLLGSCGTFASASAIRINEITTVVSAYAMASYMASVFSVGDGPGDAQEFTSSLNLASELANLPAGTTPGAVPAGEAAPVDKLDSLANIVSSCVDSPGGSAGDGSACGDLFQYAGAGTSAAATDTVSAVLAIAAAPTNNVNALYALAGASSAYQPVLASAPSDWKLALIQTPPAPTFSPNGGSYTAAQTVTLTDGDNAAALYYTTDGSTPTSSSSRYSGGISVSSSTILRAIAIDQGLISTVGSAAYTIEGPAAPEFAPAPGTYSSAQSITLADSDSSVIIYYTTDGSSPSASSPRYGGPISLSNSTTLRAVAIDGNSSSPIQTGTYTLVGPGVPVFSPLPATYSSAESVTLSDTDLSAVLYYTTDGSAPSASSARYSGPINLFSSTTIRAVAIDSGISSPIATGAYTLMPPPVPSFSPAPGNYIGIQTVTITEKTASAVVYYTIDGSNPTASSTRYSGPISLSASATIRAIAVAGALSSAVGTATYAIMPPSAPVLSPAPGTYNADLTVSLSDADSAALMYYTTDGSTPSPASERYTRPITLSATTTVSVMAFDAGLSSTFSVGTYVLAPPPPTFAPAPGAYQSPQTITLADSDLSAVIYFTTDGSTPSVASTRYSQPITLSASAIVSAAAIDDGLSSPVASGAYTIATNPQLVVPASFFGMSLLNFYNVTPVINYGTTRSWDAYPDFDWSDLNPARGVYNFTYLDHFLALNGGRDIIYTLGRTPQWASSNPNAFSTDGPGECAPPANMSDYDNFITALATHVAGKIRYWELWNEPQAVDNYCGTIPAMVTMAQHASKIIKAIDPNAMILSPAAVGFTGPNSGASWLGSFLAAGGSAYVDIIAFHGYYTATAEDVVPAIAAFRSIMVANNVANLPMWDTESSWAGDGTLSTPATAIQVGFLAKDYILHWSQGVSRFVWYAYDGGATWGGLLDADGNPTAAASAYSQTRQWLVGAVMTSPCSQTANIWTCGLTRSGGYSAEIVWAAGSTANFTAPKGFTVYRDLAGIVHPISGPQISITDQPILLESVDIGG